MSELRVNLSTAGSVRRVFFTLLLLEILFVVLDIFLNYGRLIPIGSVQRLFNIAREDSLAAWSASVQTLFVGLILWAIFLHDRKKSWALVAGFFTFLAVDDGAKFHERVGTAVKQLTNHSREIAAAESDSAIALDKSYTWQYVFGPFFIAMGVFILIFMWRELKSRNLRLLVFSALACYGLAVGLDFVEGLPAGYETIAAHSGLSAKFVNHFGRALEEFLELFGTTLFLVAFLSHFARISPRTVIHFEN